MNGTLIQHLTETAAEHIDFDTLEFGVFIDNTPALNAYRRLGFIDGGPQTRKDIVNLWRPAPD